MRHCEIHQQGCDWRIHDPAILETLPEWFFDPGALAARRLLTGTSQGRRSAYFFRHAGRDMVLRHYWRGGMVARITGDVYVWTGLEGSRPFREWRLLAAMDAAGLPVPRPVAARVCRRGLTYRGDLVTVAVPHALTFEDLIAGGDDSPATWRLVGAAIRRLHDAGYRHADLNVRNILLDRAGGPWIIDWDRGEKRNDAGWKPANLARLRRSLDKQPRLRAAAAARWPGLLDGYRTGTLPDHRAGRAPPADAGGGRPGEIERP